MKTLVIYKSKTGFAKKYAHWIGEELSADVLESSEVNAQMFNNYETIIYGGGLYAVGINGVELIKKNFDILKNKSIIVFATGASPLRDKVLTEVKENNFTVDQQKHIKFFYLRGGFDFKKLNIKDKILMTLLKWKLKKKETLTPDEKGMLHAYNNPVDFTNRDKIEEMVNYISKAN